jgi:hypothetical protein
MTVGEVLVQHKWRTADELVHMSSDDQRNALIVDLSKHTGFSISELQSKTDGGLINISLTVPI